MRFLFFSEYGEIADLAAYLSHVEGHDVVLHIPSKDYKLIAEGIVPHIEHWYRYLGKEYVWVFDSCSFGDLQDWLREQGEWVVGGCAAGDELENDRQLGQDWFVEAGFEQPYSKNFTDIDTAIIFVEAHSDQMWILKQNGDAPKHLSHKGQFEGNEDILFHLRDLKKSWNEAEYGPVDFDLMEVVEGLEVAASAFFNGETWLRNKQGKIVGFLNFEEKKEADGGTGDTCGETGTTFLGTTEDDALFAAILLRPAIEKRLQAIGFRGVFDINCIHATDGRLVALEPTCRFGVPATSYEFIEGMASPVGELLSALAKGINRTIEIHEGIGMVMCAMAKPFPLDVDVEPTGTSIGEKLWILEDGQPVEDFSEDHQRHIHLYNFQRTEDPETGEIIYRVPTKNGHMLTVTGRGSHIALCRDALIYYIKQNLYLPGMKYRMDIGARVEQVEAELEMAG
jgi:phosphoribosylamine-glycine ligase